MSNKWKFKISTDNWVTSKTIYPVPDFEIKIVREGLNSVIEIGNLTFIENSTSDYSYFLSKINAGTTKIPLRVYENGFLFAEKNIDLLTRKHDLYNTRLTFAVAADENDLLQKFIDKKDFECNLLNCQPYNDIDLNVSSKHIFLVCAGTSPAVPSGFSPSFGIDSSNIPNWDNTTFYDAINSINGWGSAGSLVVFSGQTYKCLTGNTNLQPDISPSAWALLLDESISATFKAISPNPLSGYINYVNSEDSSYHSEAGLAWSGVFGTNYADYSYFLSSLYQKEGQGETINYTLNNSRKLFDVFEGCFRQMFSYDVSSIIKKATGTDCWCNYLENSTNYNDVRIFDNSDIKFPAYESPATFTKMTFSRLLEIMKVAFGVDWNINGNGFFKFVHPSEASFFNEVDLNLSNVDGVDYSAAALNYNMKADKDVRIETFTYAASGSNYFDQVSISYKFKGALVKKSAADVTGNVMELLKGEDSQLDNSGIAWVSVENGDTVRNFNDISNGFMTAEKLFTEHSTYERPYSVGFINNFYSINLNTSNLNDADEVKCKGLLLKDINVMKLVKTKLSRLLAIPGCRIKSVSENVQSGVQSFNIEF